MSNANRGRLTVDTNGDWQQYTTPSNIFEGVGVATLGGDTGALLYCAATNKYILANDHAEWKTHPLDQRKIKAALGISNNAGAPVRLDDARACNLILDAETREIFIRLGGGARKMSEGARIAAQIAKIKT